MSLTKRLSALFPDDDTLIARLEQKLADATRAIADARTEIGAATLAIEEGDKSATARKDRAQAEIAALTARSAELEAAIATARQRKAEREARAAAEADEKRLAAARDVYDRLLAKAQAADQRVKALRADASEVLQLQSQLVVLVNTPEMANALTTTKQAFGFCVGYWLQFMPNFPVWPLMTDERAQWSAHVPPRELIV